MAARRNRKDILVIVILHDLAVRRHRNGLGSILDDMTVVVAPGPRSGQQVARHSPSERIFIPSVAVADKHTLTASLLVFDGNPSVGVEQLPTAPIPDDYPVAIPKILVDKIREGSTPNQSVGILTLFEQWVEDVVDEVPCI